MPLTIKSASEDQRLLSIAASGDARAAAALLDRHGPPAWQLAFAVLADPAEATAAVLDGSAWLLRAVGDRACVDGDVRGLLFAAVRRAAVRRLRSSVGEPAMDGDAVLATFRSLPECWRSVLWLTRGAGEPAAVAALPLQLPPADTVALAERAGHGFAERLGALLAVGAPPACRAVGDRLGRMAAGPVAPHDLALVDQHLARCRPCARQARAALDLVGTVRRVVPPPPVGLAAQLAPALTGPKRRPARRRAPRPALAGLAAAVLSLVVAVGAIARPAGGPVTESADPGGGPAIVTESPWPDVTAGDGAAVVPAAVATSDGRAVDATVAGANGRIATAPAASGPAASAVAGTGGTSGSAPSTAGGDDRVVPAVEAPGVEPGGSGTDPPLPPSEPDLVSADIVAGPVEAVATIGPEGQTTVAIGDLHFEVTA